MNEPLEPPRPTPISAHAWKQDPRTPRGVALIAYVSEIVHAAEAADPDFAPAILSDICRLEQEFEAIYGISLRVADHTLAAVHLYAEHYREHMEGEEVVTALPIRMLHRMGYVDGFYDWLPAGPEGEGENEAQEEGSEEESIRSIGLVSRIQNLFLPVYELGINFGQAERYLRIHAAERLSEIDREAEALLLSEMKEHLFIAQLEAAFEEGGEERNPYEEEADEDLAARIYKKERFFRVLAARARQWVFDQSSLSVGAAPWMLLDPVRIAELTRQLSLEMEGAEASGLEGASRRWVESRLSECIALLATFSVTPSQLYRIRRGEEDAATILSEDERVDGAGEVDADHIPPAGKMMRELSRPILNYWPPASWRAGAEVSDGAHDVYGAVLPETDRAGAEAAEAYAQRLRAAFAGSGEMGEDVVEAHVLRLIASFQEFADQEAQERGKRLWDASATLCARRIAELCEFADASARTPGALATLESRLQELRSQESEADEFSPERWWSRFTYGFLARIASLASELMLSEVYALGVDASLIAEIDRASRSIPAWVEAGLRSVELERREASGMLQEEGKGEESALMFARAQLVEEAAREGVRDRLLPALAMAVQEATNDREAIFEPGVWEVVAEAMDFVLNALYQDQEEEIVSSPRYRALYEEESAVVEFQVLEAERSALKEVTELEELGGDFEATMEEAELWLVPRERKTLLRQRREERLW